MRELARVKDNVRPVVVAAIDPFIQAQPGASFSEQAAEIELPLFERVTPPVVASEFDQVENIEASPRNRARKRGRSA